MKKCEARDCNEPAKAGYDVCESHWHNMLPIQLESKERWNPGLLFLGWTLILFSLFVGAFNGVYGCMFAIFAGIGFGCAKK